MGDDLDISIVIATHNRESILNETLRHMTELDCSGIDVEFVIVDNNSTDRTKEVVLEFSNRLPVRYLFEPKAGQNCARNRALAEAKLGKIVAFTDDDVVPNKGWLKAIMSVCERWSEYDVFGGRIYIIWPAGRIPKWAEIPCVRGLSFAEHDYAESECEYAWGKYPFSGNFWIRRKVLAGGRKFDEAVAWQPRNRILATEAMFFHGLLRDGYVFLYSPKAVVGHRVALEQLSLIYLLKRAYSGGRGAAYMQPLCRRHLLEEHPVLWRLIRMGAIGRLAFSMGVSLIPLVLEKPEKAMYAMRWIGYNVESLNIVKNCKVT